MYTPLDTEVLVPTDQDTQVARASSRALAEALSPGSGAGTRVHLATDGTPGTRLDLPLPIVRLLLGALQEMAAGNAVALRPVPVELTARQAAELLRVSRPSLMRMLDAGTLPSRKVGAHRRVRVADALRYMEAERARRAEVVEELTAETQRLGLY